jgi:hypothetical protein
MKGGTGGDLSSWKTAYVYVFQAGVLAKSSDDARSLEYLLHVPVNDRFGSCANGCSRLWAINHLVGYGEAVKVGFSFSQYSRVYLD